MSFSPLNAPLSFLALFSFSLGLTQDLQYSDCSGARVLKLSFDKDSLPAPHKIEYGEEDLFTFWYRIEAERTEELEVTISSSDPSDVYELSLYRYEGDAFCREVVHGGLSPSAIGSLEKMPETKEVRGYHPVRSQLELKKEGIYYLSVLHVKGKGCGHIALFRGPEQRAEIHAQARSCFQLPEKVEVKREEKKEEPLLKLRTGLKNARDSSLIAGKLMIMDRRSGKKRFLELQGDSSRVVRLRAKVPYRFTGEAVGYHDSSAEQVFRTDSSFLLPLERLEKGERMVLRRIYFHPNTYAFRDESRGSLDALFRFMEQNPERRIEIQGHTASDHSIKKANPLYRDKGKAWNFTGSAQELSELRAEAVKKELLRRGIDPERLEVRGFGAEQKLIESPQDRREEQRNMRVEVRILE